MCKHETTKVHLKSIYCSVGPDKILLDQMDSIVNREDAEKMGAQNIFIGKVRSTNFGRSVVAVLYDAIPSMAESELHKICGEVKDTWGSDLILVIKHRTGELKVGETSVAISVYSRHRNESYQASRYIIEEIKKRVPIWKKEIYDDGETEWLKGHALCESHAHN